MRASRWATLCFSFVTTVSLAAPTCGSLEEWTPDDVIGYVKLHDLGQHLRTLLDSGLRKELEATRMGKFLAEKDEYRNALEQLAWFESASGYKALDMVDALVGREVLVAVKANLFIPTVVLLTRTKGEEELAKCRKALEKAFTEKAGFLPSTESSSYGGYTVEKLDKGYFTSIGDIFVVGSNSLAVEEVIDLATGKAHRCVKKSAMFTDAPRDAAKGRVLSMALRPQFLPNMDKLAARMDNPLGSLLLQGWMGALYASDFVAATVDVRGHGVKLSVASRVGDKGLDERYGAFFPKDAASRVLAKFAGHGQMAVLEVHRDLAGWWEKAEDLMLPDAVGGLTQFSQTMSIFFGNRSFQDEMVPKLGRTMTVVVRGQEYKDAAERPKPSIPGFAAIFELHGAKELGRDFEVAFNSLISIVNIDRMQKKKDASPMLVRSEKVGSTNLLTVDLGSPRAKDAAPGIEFNFTPSLAVVGDHLVISSSTELSRLLVGELEKLPAAAATGVAGAVRDVVVLHAAPILAALRDNIDILVAENMKKKGIGLEESRGEMDALLELLKFPRDLRLSSSFADKKLRFDLELSLAGAEGAASEKSGGKTAVKRRDL